MQIISSYKYTILLFLILLLFICFPSICISASTRGLLLWFNTILPTLFPFFLITRLILAYNLIPRKITFLYPVFTGLIAGYPTGAITINELLRDGKINLHTSQTLMILCNNASPGFLIGIASQVFPENKYLIWLFSVLASVTVTILYLLYSIITGQLTVQNNCNKKTSAYIDRCHNISFISLLEKTVLSCATTLIIIGGYIILFSILSDYLCMIISSSDNNLKGFLAGIFEITTGISQICSNQPLPSPYSSYGHIIIAITACLCSFGGICAIMQTLGAIENSGINIKKYILHKIISAIVTGIYVLLYFTYFHR